MKDKRFRYCRRHFCFLAAASVFLTSMCGVLPPSSVSLRCAQSPRRQESRVIRSSVVVDRSLASSGRLSCSVVCVISSCVVPLLGVSRLCARCVSRVPFSFRCSVSFASCAESCRLELSVAASLFPFQIRWMTFFFVLY